MRHLLVLVVLVGTMLCITPVVAAAQTSPSGTIAGAAQLTIGDSESGGGAHIDFWQLQLSGGDQVSVNVTEPGDAYEFDLYAPGTTDSGFTQTPPVDKAGTNGSSPDVITLEAPYSGTFVLAVCENIGGDCRSVDSGGGTNPMNPYTFTMTLVNGGVSAATAAGETRARSTIATATALAVGNFESGGGDHIDFWQVKLAGGDQVNINVTEPGDGYEFDLYAPGTTDSGFTQTPPVDKAGTNGSSPDVITLEAPYSGTFVLAVCENIGGDCRSVDSGGGTNPMNPYTFTMTLVNGGVSAATAAGETRAGSTIAAATALTVGNFESGGGDHIDFWQMQLAGGDTVNFNVTEPGDGYEFDLYAPGTTDSGFTDNAPVARAGTNGSSSDVVTLEAPYSGTFVLAVCENIGGDCRSVDSGGGTNPMNPYTFTTTLVGGPPPTSGLPLTNPASKPSNSSAPAVSGTPTVGQTLSSSTGGWSGTAPISYSYQWKLCDPGCSNIGGATSSFYKPVSADAGANLDVVVTATNTAGSAQATSSEVGPIAAAGPTSAQVKASLSPVLEPSGKGAKIGALLKAGGYPFSFTAPGAGKLVIDWYATVKGKQELLASATIVFHRAGRTTVKVWLTGKGRKLLEGSKSLRLAANATFTPAGETSTSTTKNITIRR